MIINIAASESAKSLYGIKSNRENDLEEEFELDYISKNYVGINKYWFVPIVITNVDLYISNFEVSKNTLKDGKINTSKLNCKSVPWLIYKYPLPHYLQIQEDEHQYTPIPVYSPDIIRKLPILFLHSSEIKNFNDFILKNIVT